jgi:cysteinyl-tRNA synthetase
MEFMGMLQLYNTLTRKKGPFREIQKGHAGMYTCGPTVYDFAHIGNFRAYICGDILRRYLEYRGYNVRHVMNITDVDDKIIRDSRKQGISLKEFTEKYARAFFEDLGTLNIERAHLFPRATEHIAEMVSMIKELMKNGIAYKASDGSIYYDIRKFKDYGRLSGVRVGELKEGARVKQDEYAKEEANDFALWKAWDENDGDVFWETEIGKGRPGWHIECSAMSTKYLGRHFDIHAGGIDLVFPHHENEIAQSEGAFGGRFVNYWFHNEYLMVDGKKMSKSLGNFHTLRDLLEKGYNPKAIRYLLMSAHYKVQLNFTEEGIKAAEETISRLREFMLKLKDANGKGGSDAQDTVQGMIERAKAGFEKSMDDDLNISAALSSVFDLMREANGLLAQEKISREDAEAILAFMKGIDRVLGVLEFEEEKAPEEIMMLVAEREKARRSMDFGLSDSLRDEIRKKGWQVDDTKDGPKLKKIQ